jgi:hypothetical protein
MRIKKHKIKETEEEDIKILYLLVLMKEPTIKEWVRERELEEIRRDSRKNIENNYY